MSATNRQGGWEWSYKMPEEFGSIGAWRLAPDNLTQSINSGWTFGNIIVNNDNSSAPDTERALVNQISYGRQIGILLDAVAHLITLLPPGSDKEKPLAQLGELATKVTEIKEQAQAQRQQRLIAELLFLKTQDPKAWAMVMAST